MIAKLETECGSRFTNKLEGMFKLSNCFLICMEEDSIKGIYDTLKECVVISKSAGGIGVAVHYIRATGSYIRGTNRTSIGIVPMLRVFNDTAQYADHGSGKRKGSGKTLVFVLPLIMIALQEEVMMSIAPGEGPFGFIVCPSRELARQTYEVVEEFLKPMKEAGYPELRPLLCIGGVDMKSQLDVVKRGVHTVVATPGRLKDMLTKKKMNLYCCRYFKGQRQTLPFSTTMPTKIQITKNRFFRRSIVQEIYFMRRGCLIREITGSHVH